MLKKSLWGVALATVASLALLMTPSISDAQRGARGGARAGGWSGGRGWNGGNNWGGRGWDGGWNRGWNRGWGWGGFGTGLALGYGLGNWGDGYYGGYSYPYYSYPYYGGYSTPYYSSDYSYPAYTYSAPMYTDQSNMGYYGATGFQQQTNPNAVDLTVFVPDPNAQIWFENHQTQQTGTVRQFQSTVSPGQNYNFHIKARFMENGKPVDLTKDVQAQAGQHVTVNFGNAQGSNQGYQGAENLQQMPAGNVPFYGNEQGYYGNNQLNAPPQGQQPLFNNRPGTTVPNQGNLNNQNVQPGRTGTPTPGNQGATINTRPGTTSNGATINTTPGANTGGANNTEGTNAGSNSQGGNLPGR